MASSAGVVGHLLTLCATNISKKQNVSSNLSLHIDWIQTFKKRICYGDPLSNVWPGVDMVGNFLTVVLSV